jgi:hypothetical protein
MAHSIVYYDHIDFENIHNNYVFIGLELMNICQADYKQLVQHLTPL